MQTGAGCRQVQDAGLDVGAGSQCPWDVGFGCRWECGMQMQDANRGPGVRMGVNADADAG